jgi:hypothetical protein
MAEKELPITLRKQIHDYACYSAVTEAVLHYYHIRTSQETLCRGRTGPEEPKDDLSNNHVYNGEKDGCPTLKDIKNEIDADRPMIVRVAEHYILIVGYRTRGRETYIYFKDPIKGDERISVLYTDFKAYGFPTKYPTREHPAGKEDNYRATGHYFIKPPHVAYGEGGGRRGRRARRARRSTRRRARGRRSMTRRADRL